jgi:hypothetical protein
LIKIAHLYPHHLNLYGDIGNIITFANRLKWRSIDFCIDEISLGEQVKKYKDYDLIFIGGGQDRQQEEIAADIASRRNELFDLVENNLPVLAVCGGYQLLGKYYQTSEGHEIAGLDILGIITKAPSQQKNSKQDRLIGNVSAKLLLEMQFNTELKTLVGFENHSGRTFIVDQNTKPLAQIIKGFGNNAEDVFEGAYYKNLIGTYVHGSLLPKNPHLADEILYRAIKYSGKNYSLNALDDSFELEAHNFALKL